MDVKRDVIFWQLRVVEASVSEVVHRVDAFPAHIHLLVERLDQLEQDEIILVSNKTHRRQPQYFLPLHPIPNAA